MKNSLKNKIQEQGRLADELVKTEGYKFISKKMDTKIELMLKEALNSETIENLKYAKGVIDGLSYFKDTLETMISKREALKRNN